MMKNMFSESMYGEKDDVPVREDFDKLPDFNPENPQTFFDIEIGNPEDPPEEKKKGRVVFELFHNVVKKTAENFR